MCAVRVVAVAAETEKYSGGRKMVGEDSNMHFFGPAAT